MRKNWTAIALALGSAIMISSIAWEYARTSPDYTFLIQPWSIRGFEMIHGAVIATAALLFLIAALLTSTERAVKPLNSALIVGYIVLAATGFSAVFAQDSMTFTVSPALSIILAIVLGVAGSLMLRNLFGDSVRVLKRAIVTFLPLALAVFFALGAVVGNTVIVPTWIAVFILFSGIGSFSLASNPIDMGANRMLIVAAVACWALVTFSAGAIRQTLVNLQLATEQGEGVFGVAAAYKDTQAAAGWWLAGFGGFVMFVGAVGLWARRRDVVATISRAKKQRAAAEISAREIADAAEAYEREHEAAKSS